MSSFSTSIINGLKQIESALGNNTFNYKGTDYICSPSGFGSGGSFDEGGMGLESDLVINVRTSLFSSDGVYPAAMEYITYKSKQYRITNVKRNATDSFLRMELVDPNKDL